MLINNVNKVITGKTALQKMLEIRRRLENERCSMKEIEEKINEYFSNHKTVLTTYGSLKPYRIQEIAYDRTPKNTDFYIFDANGKKTTVNLINYYSKQYGIKIVNLNQPFNNRRNKGRNIINKTKMDHNKKMSAINGIFNLYNSNKHKIIKKNVGKR